MKTSLICSLALFVFSCANSKQDEARKIKEIVCGDSIEQELFDQNGNTFFTRIPGKCDTIYESVEE